MSPGSSEIKFPLAYSLHLTHRAFWPRKVSNDNSTRARMGYETSCSNHDRFEPYSAAGDHVFVEHLNFMAYTACPMAHNGNFRYSLHRSGRYWIIISRPVYTKRYKESTENTVFISLLMRVTKHVGPGMESMTDPKLHNEIIPAKHQSITSLLAPTL